MRGPGYKLTGDVRRTWRCPNCGRERKLQGDVTSLQCGCQPESWMAIVAERNVVPRPLQRPSDVERRPIDFGIEPLPAAPAKPVATIVKSAISLDSEPEATPVNVEPQTDPSPKHQVVAPKPQEDEDDWGEGIL